MLTLAGKLNTQDPGTLAEDFEADRVNGAFRGQMLARSITKVAVRAQSLVVTGRMRYASSTMAGEAVSEGEPVTVRPKLALVGFGWNKKGTGHEVLSLKDLFYSAMHRDGTTIPTFNERRRMWSLIPRICAIEM